MGASMIARLRHDSCWQRAALGLALAALVLRIAVPAGWMPQATDGGFRIAMCHAIPDAATRIDMAAAQALLDAALDTGEPEPAKQVPGDPDCAFAGFAGPMALHDVAPLTDTVAPNEARPVFHPYRNSAPGRGLAAPPPPATGPPSLA